MKKQFILALSLITIVSASAQENPDLSQITKTVLEHTYGIMNEASAKLEEFAKENPYSEENTALYELFMANSEKEYKKAIAKEFIQFKKAIKNYIAAGGDINEPLNKNNKTALMACAQYQLSHLVTILLAAGADASLQDTNGKTACDHAIFSNYVDQGKNNTVALCSAYDPQNHLKTIRYLLNTMPKAEQYSTFETSAKPFMLALVQQETMFLKPEILKALKAQADQFVGPLYAQFLNMNNKILKKMIVDYQLPDLVGQFSNVLLSTYIDQLKQTGVFTTEFDLLLPLCNELDQLLCALTGSEGDIDKMAAAITIFRTEATTLFPKDILLTTIHYLFDTVIAAAQDAKKNEMLISFLANGKIKTLFAVYMPEEN